MIRVVSEGQGVERPRWSSSGQTREKEIGNSEGGQQLGVFGYREQKIGHVRSRGFSLKWEQFQHVCTLLGIVQEKEDVTMSERRIISGMLSISRCGSCPSLRNK